MIVLSADSITKHFGPEPVLAGATFDVRSGDRIGLVGPNGTGKTTLLNILAGQLEADSGQVQRPSSMPVGYLKQQADFDGEATLYDEAKKALAHLIALSEESETLANRISQTTEPRERAALEERFDTIQVRLRQHDAYHLEHKIDRVLHGVGFEDSVFQQPVVQLSGGQQNRLMLAKLLLSAPDLMFLDEPSNHLDIDATTWLEEYLVNAGQTLIVVSHDRYFLDRVTDRTLELFHGTVVSYRGNFSAYWCQKLERVEFERRTYENQQSEIAKLEDFIRRHHHGQKHAQAEDRRRKLERIELVDPPREIQTPVMGFPKVDRSGDLVLRAEKISKSFDQTLFANLSLDIQRGERWGIVGANGCGKTTLLRCLLTQEPTDSGSVALGTGVGIGYFDQLLNSLESNEPAVELVRPPNKEFNEQQRRDLLARFGIQGDMVFQPVRQLSGGERNRVALARLAASDANLLVLDEPTNHLDLWARDALESALKQFNGTVLFVSHDRFFLNQVADHLVVLENGQHTIVHGNFDLYQRMRQVNSNSTPAATEDPSRGSSKRQSSGDNKPRRKRKFPYRKVADIEAEIMEHEGQIEQLHHQLTQPDVLRDGRRVKEVQGLIDEQQQKLATLYEHWEEASELN